MPGVTADPAVVAFAGADDHFVFHTGDGIDTIANFAPADVVDIHVNGISTFAALQPFMAQAGADTVIAFDAHDQIVLHDVQIAQLNSGDFLFG